MTSTMANDSMRVSAKHVIIELLSAGPITGENMPVRELVRAAQAFGIAENSVRVAIVRLRADGLVESTERGHYLLGPAARPVDERVKRWRDAESLMSPWDGSWIAVFTADLPRTDRPALRKRARALRLLGFRDLRDGLHIRPNNLSGPLDDLRSRLVRLGLEPGATVFHVSDLATQDEERARTLWDVASLRAVYKDLVEQLDKMTDSFPTMPIEQTIRESFLVGREAIRMIVLDPLLPEPLIPTSERRALIDSMKRFDTSARVYWRKYMEDIAAVS